MRQDDLRIGGNDRCLELDVLCSQHIAIFAKTVRCKKYQIKLRGDKNNSESANLLLMNVK
ncbi:hypothetical protein LV84_02727 [Algoriphagus ratkowskyi]|uniref:Uncharacterized protein n=1 Tax=Algoriphagus ratkowskyi TaxID=57028 RepID=A0A2W7R1Z9_9BACT|nr:hypothetical protein LV84_02727 [Algoriphagus ratkowskyi]